jgi:hypothetical protein
VKNPSGRFVLRIPPKLHARLKGQAACTGLSLNEICVKLLESASSPRDNRGLTLPATLLPEAFLNRIMNQWGSVLLGLILFGSTARREDAPGSDVDLLMVLDGTLPLSRALYATWDRLLAECKPDQIREFSPQFVNLPMDPMAAGGLWYEVAVEGILLWERDWRISRFLASTRVAMARGDIIRREIHGHPYWLKEKGERA